MLLIFFFLGSCRQTIQRSPLISEVDKKELIRLMLGRVVEQGRWFCYHVVQEGKKKLILSAENIEKELLPEFPEVEIVVLTPSELREKADKEGRFAYLRFGQWRAIGKDTVQIDLDGIWQLGEQDVGVIILSGGGLRFLWVREEGKWVNYGRTAWHSQKLESVAHRSPYA